MGSCVAWTRCAAARPLEGFRIKAKQIRQGAATRKGYLRSDFTDAFRPPATRGSVLSLSSENVPLTVQ
jgi:Protein of unknown function (DUF3631)